MHECYYCGKKAVIWDCDYDADDMGYEGPGIVKTFHCQNCGADIEYVILEENTKVESTIQ